LGVARVGSDTFAPQAAPHERRRAWPQRPRKQAETLPQSDHASNVHIPAVQSI